MENKVAPQGELVSTGTPETPLSSEPRPDPLLPGAKRISRSQVRALFPHARLIENEINRRFAARVGRPVDPKRLFQALRNLGDTDPAKFIARLDGELEIFGRQGSYGRLPQVAKEVAIFEAPLRSRAAGGGQC
jgi:hypothetical protein